MSLNAFSNGIVVFFDMSLCLDSSKLGHEGHLTSAVLQTLKVFERL